MYNVHDIVVHVVKVIIYMYCIHRSSALSDHVIHTHLIMFVGF